MNILKNELIDILFVYQTGPQQYCFVYKLQNNNFYLLLRIVETASLLFWCPHIVLFKNIYCLTVPK